MALTSRGEIIHLPGTTLEGGGQLLRLAVGLAALTLTPIRVSNIRGNRSGGGGLKAQHLASIVWLAAACGARVKGMEKKSKELIFIPESADLGDSEMPKGLTQVIRGISRTIDIGTPGAVTLVLQAILPYLVFTPASEPVSIKILGGTNVSNSPSVDYVIHVLLPMLALTGLHDCIHVRVDERGWSTGRNEMGGITLTVQPLSRDTPLSSFSITQRGGIKRIEAIVLAPKSLHNTFAAHVREAVVKTRRLGIRFEKEDLTVTTEESGHSKRLYLLLIAISENGHRLARDWLWGADVDFRSMRSSKSRSKGKGGKLTRGDADEDVETTISNAVEYVVSKLAEEIAHGGCVDEYMRDQLVAFQTLAGGGSAVDGGRSQDEPVKASLHAQTAQWVAHEMLGVNFADDGSCAGIGLKPGGADTAPTTDDAGLATQLEHLQI